MTAKRVLTTYSGRTELFRDDDGMSTPCELIIPSSDHSVSGRITNAFDAGETISAFDCLYMKSDGKWWKADASWQTSGDVRNAANLARVENDLAIALESGTANNAISVALPGSLIRDDSWNWTVGAPVYIAESAGGLTQTLPDLVRQVGVAVSADVLRFDPRPREKLFLFAYLSANQTTDIAVGDRIDFDTIESNYQLNCDGQFYLPAGYNFAIEGNATGNFGSSGGFWTQWYNMQASGDTGSIGGSSTSRAGTPAVAQKRTTTQQITLELRVKFNSNATYVYSGYGTFVKILEI